MWYRRRSKVKENLFWQYWLRVWLELCLTYKIPYNCSEISSSSIKSASWFTYLFLNIVWDVRLGVPTDPWCSLEQLEFVVGVKEGISVIGLKLVIDSVGVVVVWVQEGGEVGFIRVIGWWIGGWGFGVVWWWMIYLYNWLHRFL
jgi:hypothetical protein